MTYDPFSGHKNKITKVQQVILSPSDIQAIYKKEFAIERLRIVRDAFIFCCYTGMSFIDLLELKKSEIIKAVDGSLWIIKKRHKTGVPCNVPMLPVALEIMEHYTDHPQCVDSGLMRMVYYNNQFKQRTLFDRSQTLLDLKNKSLQKLLRFIIFDYVCYS